MRREFYAIKCNSAKTHVLCFQLTSESFASFALASLSRVSKSATSSADTTAVKKHFRCSREPRGESGLKLSKTKRTKLVRTALEFRVKRKLY